MECMGARVPVDAVDHWRAMPPHDTPHENFSIDARRMSVLVCTGDNMGGAAGRAMENVAALLHATGQKLPDIVPLVDAQAHMDRMIALDAVILSCSGHEAGAEALLRWLGERALAGHLAVVVITDLAGLDRVHGNLGSDRPVILCDPSTEDVVAAIAALAEHQDTGSHLHDIGAEAEADRFQRLNDQLLRLNRMVEALVQDRTPEDSYLRPWGAASEPALKSPVRSYNSGKAEEIAHSEPITAHQVRAMLRVRRLRDHLVAPDLFADPAWDILLDLLAARLENAKVSVSSLCIAAAVPPTTALRWIRQLTDRGLLERRADPRDGRRIFITLSDEGMHAVVRWFHESRTHLHSALGVAGESR